MNAEARGRLAIFFNCVFGGWKSIVGGALVNLPGFETACADSFDKPLFLCLLYNLAGLSVHYVQPGWQTKGQTSITDPRVRGRIILLAICAFGAEICSYCAYVYISASMVEMLQFCSRLTVACFATKFWRAAYFEWTHWSAIPLSIIGIVLITYAIEQEADTVAFLGLTLSMLSAVFYAAKVMILEELTHDYRVNETACLIGQSVISMGMCVVILPIAWALPGQDCGRLESLPDMWVKLNGSIADPPISVFWLYVCFGLFVAFTLGMNIGTFNLVAEKAALDKCLWDFFRVIVAWVSNIALFYIAVIFDPDTTLGDQISQNVWIILVGLCFGLASMYAYYLRPLGMSLLIINTIHSLFLSLTFTLTSSTQLSKPIHIYMHSHIITPAKIMYLFTLLLVILLLGKPNIHFDPLQASEAALSYQPSHLGGIADMRPPSPLFGDSQRPGTVELSSNLSKNKGNFAARVAEGYGSNN